MEQSRKTRVRRKNEFSDPRDVPPSQLGLRATRIRRVKVDGTSWLQVAVEIPDDASSNSDDECEMPTLTH